MNLSKLSKAIQFSKIGIATYTIQKFNKAAGQQYLLQEIGKLPGIPAKMGQILLMKTKHAPSEIFTPKAFPLAWVKQHIINESPILSEQIESIDEKAFTASLGQVHRAILKNKSEIAIKLRYPGIENEIQEQLELLMGIFKNAPAPSVMKMNTDDYSSFLKDFFDEEINYQKEAQSQKRFHKLWSFDPRFIIPEVFLNYTTSSMLVQSFESSTSLSLIHDFTLEERIHYFNAMKDFFINGLLNFGLIHTDLHEKNWGIRRETKQIVFYDFGATIQLSIELKNTLIHLSMMHNNPSLDYLNAFVTLGFDREKLIKIQSKLPALCKILFEPIQNHEKWNPAEWNLQKRVNELLEHDKWIFRTSGPPWFLLFIRGLNGWMNAVLTLKGQPETISKLYIRITEKQKEKASLEFPAHSVDNLEDLIPDNALEMIRTNGIQLNQIIQQVKKTNYAPQVLFETAYLSKTYKVWLA